MGAGFGRELNNPGMTPNINPNSPGRKTSKRGRKTFFDPAIFEEPSIRDGISRAAGFAS